MESFFSLSPNVTPDIENFSQLPTLRKCTLAVKLSKRLFLPRDKHLSAAETSRRCVIKKLGNTFVPETLLFAGRLV